MTIIVKIIKKINEFPFIYYKKWRFNVSAKIYSTDLKAELANRVECRIEIESKSLTLSTNSRSLDQSNKSMDQQTTTLTNPTLLIDEQLFKDSKTISLVGVLVLTLFVSILGCSSLMWFKCRHKASNLRRSLSSSMSSGSPSPSSEPTSVTKIKENKGHAVKSDFKRAFSVRLPFDFFDRSQTTRTNNNDNDKMGSKKFGVSFWKVLNIVMNKYFKIK